MSIVVTPQRRGVSKNGSLRPAVAPGIRMGIPMRVVDEDGEV